MFLVFSQMQASPIQESLTLQVVQELKEREKSVLHIANIVKYSVRLALPLKNQF